MLTLKQRGHILDRGAVPRISTIRTLNVLCNESKDWKYYRHLW